MRLASVRVDASRDRNIPDSGRLPESTALTWWSHQPELVRLHICVYRCSITVSCKVFTDSQTHRHPLLNGICLAFPLLPPGQLLPKRFSSVYE